MRGADTAFLTLHPALRIIRRRVHQQTVATQLERALLVAAVGALLVVLVGRLAALPDWTTSAIAWSVLVPLAWTTIAAFRTPDAWRVARAADALGLRERATTALHLLRAGAGGGSARSLVIADATDHLGRIDPDALPAAPTRDARRRWLTAGLVALTLILALAPLPPIGPLRAAQRRAAEARAAESARQAVQALGAKVPKTTDDALARSTAEELRRLAEQLRQTRSTDDAARALARSQERIAALPREDDYARQRAIEAAAQQLTQSNQPDLSALSQALRRGEPQAIEQAAGALAGRLDQLSADDRRALQAALQSAANAARDVPNLAQSLRDAARDLAGATDPNDPEARQRAQRSLQDATSQLADAAERAAALRAAQDSVAGLGSARAALDQLGQLGPLSDVTLPPGAQAGSGQASGTVVAISGTLVPASATGTPTAAILVQGQGQGAGQPGQGQGAPGSPGLGQSGQSGQPGGGASPDGTRPLDPNAAPRLLGGEDGAALRARGDATSASGAGVGLPNSPVALGADRPYEEVYAEYEATARQSVARQSLPPPLRGLVQRYFSAIEPEDGS